MINLEWLRTFRAVYRTKSLSKASELLNISQPTVSQQIKTLEAHIGQVLFVRKSKGVLETDEGRILNTLISGSIESLEEVEHQILQKKSKLKNIITIGVSSHLYKTTLCHAALELGEFVHIQFGTKQSLITDVEQGKLLYAMIPDEVNTFDIICQPLYKQPLILVHTPDIDLSGFNKLYKSDLRKAEQLLTNQIWYAHNTASSYIKLLWITAFNKKRPAVIPNYVIPNEYEVLFQLSRGSGLSVALEQNAAPFLKDGSLKKGPIKSVPFRKMSLIANKKKAAPELIQRLHGMLAK
ncbi:MAG: LysR family transcriptional regulator [Saprospiraceae bacterium]